MSTEAAVAARPQALEAAPPWSASHRHPVALSCVSALLLWCSFPPTDWNWLSWGALAPLFLLIRSARPRRVVYFAAWAGGMLFWTLAIQWVRLTDDDAWLAWLVMALALSVWWPGFLLLTRVAVLRLGAPVLAAAPVVWVGLEYVRVHILTGFPWYYLAHTQHRILPLIQIADVTGALGVSVLVALVNAWLAELLARPRFEPTPTGRRLARPHVVGAVIVLTAVGSTAGYGAYRLATAEFRDGPRIALLQSDLAQSRKDPSNAEQIQLLFQNLVTRAIRNRPKPDLIVWPETSYPWPFVLHDPGLSDAAYERQARAIDKARGREFWSDWETGTLLQLHEWTDQAKTPMLVGSIVHDFRPAGYAKYNSAVLFTPGVQALQRYAKIHLVPFGEYVPLLEVFPWLTVLTPYRGASVPRLSFGAEPSWFDLGPYRLAAAICFEDTIPQAVRRFFTGQARQPDVVINISNDGWFQGSSEHDMHLAVSVFRAIENRTPLARAVNKGISAVVDGNGRVVASLQKQTEGVLTHVVPLDDRTTLYSEWGDWVGVACLTLTLALLPACLAQSLPSRRPA